MVGRDGGLSLGWGTYMPASMASAPRKAYGYLPRDGQPGLLENNGLFASCHPGIALLEQRFDLLSSRLGGGGRKVVRDADRLVTLGLTLGKL